MSDSKKKVTKLAPSNAQRPYKVRKVFEDGSTQLAAFKSLDAAKKKVDENPEYKVFDGRNGKLLYEVEVPAYDMPQFEFIPDEESGIEFVNESAGTDQFCYTEDLENIPESVTYTNNVDDFNPEKDYVDIMHKLATSDNEETRIVEGYSDETVSAVFNGSEPLDEVDQIDKTYEDIKEEDKDASYKVPGSDAILYKVSIQKVNKENFIKRFFNKFRRK